MLRWGRRYRPEGRPMYLSLRDSPTLYREDGFAYQTRLFMRRYSVVCYPSAPLVTVA